MSGFEEVAAYAALAAAAVGTVATVSQADSQRKQQHSAADLKVEQANEISSQATQQIEGQRARARSIIGSQLASTSESGTGLSGANLDLLNQSITNSAMDSMDIRHGANLNAAGLNTQASLNGMNASDATTGRDMSAAGQLIGGYPRYNCYTAHGAKIPGWDLSGTDRGSGD
jgi:uncharacterized protein YjbI with pentapeptide repeats